MSGNIPASGSPEGAVAEDVAVAYLHAKRRVDAAVGELAAASLEDKTADQIRSRLADPDLAEDRATLLEHAHQPTSRGVIAIAPPAESIGEGER